MRRFGWRNHAAHCRKEITMRLLTQKISKLIFAEAIRVVTLALLVVVLGASATLAQNNQVSFTVTATGTITGVTKLPGGLTQINFNGSGNATYLGSVLVR